MSEQQSITWMNPKDEIKNHNSFIAEKLFYRLKT